MSQPSNIDAIALAERAIREIAEDCLPHASLVLFGSRARGDARRRSDFDLAVFPKAGFEERELVWFSDRLEESSRIIYPIDVVDTRTASETMLEKIKREGVSWKD